MRAILVISPGLSRSITRASIVIRKSAIPTCRFTGFDGFIGVMKKIMIAGLLVLGATGWIVVGVCFNRIPSTQVQDKPSIEELRMEVDFNRMMSAERARGDQLDVDNARMEARTKALNTDTERIRKETEELQRR